jgi:hypothetical protein
MSTATETQTTEATNGSTETAAAATNKGGSGGARPKPTYKAEKMTGELPADLTLPRSGPRTDPAFTEAMTVAQADPGEFYCVATFQSANGARTLLKRIQKNEVKIPTGDWDLEARRVSAPDSTEENPVRWSKLFAKFLG